MSYADDSKVRIETKTVTYTIEAKPPHNFYSISTSKGMLPKALRGSYTTIPAASKAVESYLKQNDKSITN